jgi:hypothetical protein
MPLCLRLIKEIHERLMHDVRGSEKRPGHFARAPSFSAGTVNPSRKRASCRPRRQN